MKTLTEFSGTMIRMAARAEQAARKAIPKELLTVAPAQAAAPAVTAKPSETASAAAPDGAAQSATDAADQALAEQAVGGATDVSGAAEGREPKPGEAGTGEDEMQPGAAEEEVAGAKKIGEFQYVVDLMPQSMKQVFEQKDDKKRGPRRPTGGGKKGQEGSLEGSFSMESVAQDRRSERGPGGAGRGGPGGGRGRGGPGGGKPGGGRGGPGGGRGGPGGGRGPKPGGAPKS